MSDRKSQSFYRKFPRPVGELTTTAGSKVTGRAGTRHDTRRDLNTDLEVGTPGPGSALRLPSGLQTRTVIQSRPTAWVRGWDGGAGSPAWLWGVPWPRALTFSPHPRTVRAALRIGITSNVCHPPCAVWLMTASPPAGVPASQCPGRGFSLLPAHQQVSCRDPEGSRAELRNGPHDSGTQPCSASYPDGTVFSDTDSSFLLGSACLWDSPSSDPTAARLEAGVCVCVCAHACKHPPVWTLRFGDEKHL